MSISMQFRRWQHVRFSNPPAIEVFNFTLLVEKKIENKSVYAKKEKRKMEEIVTYETLLFALVSFFNRTVDRKSKPRSELSMDFS